MKKAILINSELRTFEYVNVAEGIQDIYKHIGNNCSTFACPIMFKNHDTMYVDDEAMLNEPTSGIMMEDWRYPLAGNILIMGTDIETGDSVDVKTTIEELKPQIKFVVFA